jgi:hypothetical protein
MKVVIHLYHGRKDPQEQLEDWGEDGPLLGPFDGIHHTYLHHIRPVIDGDSPADLAVVEDMYYYDGMYYGDMVIQSEELAKKEFPNKEIEAFDPNKCKSFVEN